MKFTRRNAAKLLASPIIFHAATMASTTRASADCKTAESREAVQAAMLEYIDTTSFQGQHLIFDAIQGEFVKAKFIRLHKNLVMVENTFYVSCADFEEENGELLDVDYMVARSHGYWSFFQPVIHLRHGKLRESHMETSKVLFAREGCCAAKKCCAAKTCCAAKKCCAASK
jgi:hypothetical protein